MFLTPHFLPCVLPPKPWNILRRHGKHPVIRGGYHTLDVKRRYNFVRGRATSGWAAEHLRLLSQGHIPDVFAAVNAVQSTAWKINRRVYDVLKPITPETIRVRMLDTDTERRWEVEVSNPTFRALAIAERFLDDAAIYFPHTLQVSGRLQPGPVDLNPNGNDAVKALLTFAHGKPLKTQEAADALAVHGANCFGGVKGAAGGKPTLVERIAWVKEHEQGILAIARDPNAHSVVKESASDPWQFLAFCFEWEGYTRDGLRFVSSLPVTADGTCSGLQHLSVMLRDEEGGRETNLVPSDAPQDLYRTIAEKVGMPREQVKPPVMVYLYGEGPKSRREKFMQGGMTKAEAAIAERKVLAAIKSTVGEAAKVMDWLQDIARRSADRDRPMHWQTPAGLPVWLIKGEEESVRFDMEAGEIRKALWFKLPKADSEGVAIPDKDDMVTGITAIFVHSMDAAHLMLTMAEAWRAGMRSLTTVHDNFGTVAADAPKLWRILREQFVAMYEKHDVLAELRAQLNAACPELDIPAPPEHGKLNLQGVKQSKYFFS